MTASWLILILDNMKKYCRLTDTGFQLNGFTGQCHNFVTLYIIYYKSLIIATLLLYDIIIFNWMWLVQYWCWKNGQSNRLYYIFCLLLGIYLLTFHICSLSLTALSSFKGWYICVCSKWCRNSHIITQMTCNTQKYLQCT